MRTIPPSWHFAMWGLDAVGPFRIAPGGYKYILVAVDVNTKNWYRRRLTCGPNLAGEYHSARDFLQRIR
jgi:hypothetical protein